jgi:hypothetical protein
MKPIMDCPFVPNFVFACIICITYACCQRMLLIGAKLKRLRKNNTMD